MASSRHTVVAVQLAVQAERIRCLEAQVELLQAALLAAAAKPVEVNVGGTNSPYPAADRFGALAERMLANADPAEPAPAPEPPKPVRHTEWFPAALYRDGVVPTPTPEA